MGPAGGTGTIDVTALPSCGWNATVDQYSFVQITGQTGIGNGVVSYSVRPMGPNSTDPDLSATITVAGQAFVVKQTGCHFGIAPASASFDAAGGTAMVVVTGAAECLWTVWSDTSA